MLSGGNGAIDTQSFDTTLSGKIEGAGALIKRGAGNAVLTSDNVYTGGTVISGGKLILGDGAAEGEEGHTGRGTPGLELAIFAETPKPAGRNSGCHPTRDHG